MSLQTMSMASADTLSERERVLELNSESDANVEILLLTFGAIGVDGPVDLVGRADFVVVAGSSR